MCLRINKVFSSRKEAREFSHSPSIAKKDIVVFKGFMKRISPTGRIIEGKLRSPYSYFNYDRGFIYYQTGKPFSFSITKNAWRSENKWDIDINRGLHSCKTPNRAADHGDIVIKCIIPKGSLYFEDKEECVSNQLLIPHK